MKDYKEIANTVLKRRDDYETEKKEQRKRFTKQILPICCICLVTIFGFSIGMGGLFKGTPEEGLGDTLYPGVKDNFDELGGESIKNPSANNKIVINKVDSVSADKFNICLLIDDFVKMDKAAVNEYYGINVFPEVPSDIPEWKDATYGIYKKNGGTGEVYWDQMVLNFDNEDFSRGVNLEIKKGSLPLLDYVLGESAEEKSIINNWEVVIGLSKDGYYHAVFMYHDVGFCVNARGLTQDEFVAVLSSLIK